MKKKLLSLVLIATCTSYINASEGVIPGVAEQATAQAGDFLMAVKKRIAQYLYLVKTDVLNGVDYTKNNVYSHINANSTGAFYGAIFGFETVEWILNRFNCCKNKLSVNYAARMLGAAVGSGLGAMYAQNEKYRMLLALAAVGVVGANHHDLIEVQLS